LNLSAVAMLLHGCSKAATPRRGECTSSSRSSSRRWQCNRWRAPPLASVRSAIEGQRYPRINRTHLSSGINTEAVMPRPQLWWSRAVLGPTATLGTPSRHVDGLRVLTSTTTTATVHTTTTTEGADENTTAMMTATVAGHRTKGARELLAGTCGMHGSPRVSELQSMFPGTTAHQS
jgi:hypothetical protein